MSKERKTLLNRTAIALVLAAVVLISNYVGSFMWAGLTVLSSLLALREFNRLCFSKGIFPSTFWNRILVVLFILTPLALESKYVFACQGFMIALSFTIILFRMFLRSRDTNFADVSASLWSIIYLGLLPSYYIWIRGLEHGLELIVVLTFTVAFSDVAAMFAGKYFGKIPLSPQISPNKTVEGSVAGLLCATAVFYFWVKFFNLNLNYDAFYSFVPNIVRYESIVICCLGLIIAFVSQIGDLLESLFKREAGVKDSGTLLESHGGVLDRLDSHFFSVWIAYFIFYYLIG